jgi:hypothetical protein
MPPGEKAGYPYMAGASMEEKPKAESLDELERIEGNYYKVDLFVGSALVLFTIWVEWLEKNRGWVVFLGLLAFLFLLRGLINWRRRGRDKSGPEDSLN